MKPEENNMKCEAHDLLEKEINRCKDNEQELYTLDRKRAQDMAEIKSDIAEIKADHKNMKEDIIEFKKDLNIVKLEQAEMKTDVKDLKKLQEVTQQEVKSLKTLTENSLSKKKWEPKDWTVVIVALLSLAGTIITAFLR